MSNNINVNSHVSFPDTYNTQNIPTETITTSKCGPVISSTSTTIITPITPTTPITTIPVSSTTTYSCPGFQNTYTAPLTNTTTYISNTVYPNIIKTSRYCPNYGYII